jgi:iron complex outermembrane receptor protein
VVVEGTRLVADAAGTTRVQLDDTIAPDSLRMGPVLDRVANLHLADGGAGSFGSLLSLRGLSNTPYFSDPAVTVYFDDLPLTGGFTYPTDLFGFGTVTVYRGPRASSFGRAGEAGVVVFNSVAPAAMAHGEARASFGNFDAWSGAVTARTAQGTVADATVSAAVSTRDGFIRNTQLNSRVDDQHTTSASARVRVRPSRTTELTVQVLGNRLRNGAQPLVPLNGPLFSVARGAEGATESDFGGVAVKGTAQTAFGQVTSTTSYTNWTLNPFTNRLVLPPPLDSSLSQTQRAWNEEIRASSPAHARIPWTVGAWFSNARTNGSVLRAIPNLFPIEGSNYVARARTYAVFGEALAMGEDDWRLTAGLRAEEVRKEFARTQTIPGPDYFESAKTFKSLSPRVTGSWLLSADTSASVTWSVGSRPGGWSAYTAYPSLSRFRAEKTNALEAGFDTSFAHRTFTLAARAFTYSIQEFQIERSFTQSDYIVVNAPRARSEGGEIEASWHATSALTLAASAGVARVTLREFTDPFTGTAYNGKRAPYVPAFNSTVSATYRIAGWFATGEWIVTGRTYYEESNDRSVMQDQHSLLNARLGYDTPRWRVTLFGENLENEQYYALMIPGIGHGVPGAPRTYGVEALVKW